MEDYGHCPKISSSERLIRDVLNMAACSHHWRREKQQQAGSQLCATPLLDQQLRSLAMSENARLRCSSSKEPVGTVEY